MTKEQRWFYEGIGMTTGQVGNLVYGACKCDRGFYPDIIIPVQQYKSANKWLSLFSGSPEFVQQPCTFQWKCDANDPHAIELDKKAAYCECADGSDAYPAIDPVRGVTTCKESCSVDRCNSHGHCVYNWIKNPRQPNLTTSELPFWNTSYINDCLCDSGWRSTFEFTPGDFENPFKVVSTKLCTQPFDILNGKVCGEGGESFVGDQCQCKPIEIAPGYSPETHPEALVEYTIHPQTGLCARQCPNLDARFWNATSEGVKWKSEFTAQVCGGPDRGECVLSTEFTSSMVCQCRNGYSGYACQNAMCPRQNGNGPMCSGRGTCDEGTGQCVCMTGFVGRSCEVKLSECDISQTKQSYPEPVSLSVGMDIDAQ